MDQPTEEIYLLRTEVANIKGKIDLTFVLHPVRRAQSVAVTGMLCVPEAGPMLIASQVVITVKPPCSHIRVLAGVRRKCTPAAAVEGNVPIPALHVLL